MVNLSICSIMKELNKVVMKNTTHFLSEDAVWESVSEFVSVVACRRAGVHDRLLLGTYRQMIVGTGDVPGAVNFYTNCGFEYSHRVENFFTDNYDHQMVEDGLLLKEMIYFKQKI